MYDCLVLTASTVDNIIEMEGQFPIDGGTSRGVLANYLEPGGEGNFLIVFTRMGGKVLPCGPVGDDYYGDFLCSSLSNEGVDISGLRRIHGYSSPIANCLIAENGIHSFVSQLGGMEFCSVEEAFSELDRCKGYFLSGYYLSDVNHVYYNLALSLFRKAIKDGKMVFFDSGPYVENIREEDLDEILPHLSVASLNEREACVLADSDDPVIALERLSERMIDGLAVVKVGKEGCYAKRHGAKMKHYPAIDVKVVDTTGCGDSFLASLMYAKLSGWGDDASLTLANAVGSVKASKMGTGTKCLTFDEVVAILEKSGYAVSEESRLLRRFLEPDCLGENS